MGGLQQKAATSFSAAALLLETNKDPGPRASVPVCWELDDHMTTHYYLPIGERANEWKDILYM
jgi:hypothetical protein